MGTFGTPSSYNNTGALGSTTNPTTAQGLSRDRENQKALLELPGTQAWVEKTITDGVIVPTSAEIIVLPEGGASTDSLTTIVLTSDGTTTLHEGMLIRLKAANSNTITVVHGTGANNISTIDGNNVVLDTTLYLELKLINGLWVQQETSAYKTANEAKVSAATAQALASGAFILSGTCSTGASVAAKVVDLSGYILRAGSSISVTFSNANTVADAITLNVNGTGAKSVYNQTGIISASNTALFAANQPIEFRYDGTGWVFYDVTKAVSSGTYAAASSTAAGTAAKEATCAGFSLQNQARIFVTFSNANTVAGALTLNVNGTGAKPIYLGNSAASATNPFFIPAGVALEFVYNGTAWVHTSCIVESWENSGRGLWYKKWSNGLIEQGIDGDGPTTVTFPTPFLRSDKTLFYKFGFLNGDTSAYSPTFVVTSASLTGAVVSPRVNGTGTPGLYWTFEVSGY